MRLDLALRLGLDSRFGFRVKFRIVVLVWVQGLGFGSGLSSVLLPLDVNLRCTSWIFQILL